MLEELQIADELHKEGRLDKKLKRRLWIFEILSFVFGLITVYDILFEGFYWFHVFLAVSVSFLFGFWVLEKINKVVWDKKRQIMVTEKMDIWAVLILVFYISSRIISDVYLHDFFDGNLPSVFAYTFFTAFGITLGRFVGTLFSIYMAQPKSFLKFRLRKK